MSILQRYHVGTAVILSTEVRNENRNLVTPANLRLRLRRESDAETVYTLAQLTNAGLGLYEVRHVVGSPGTWYWRWESTDPTDADEGLFRVVESEFS